MNTATVLLTNLDIIFITVAITILIVIAFRRGVCCGVRRHAGVLITPAVAATYFRGKPFTVNFLSSRAYGGDQHVYEIRLDCIGTKHYYVCDVLLRIVEGCSYGFDSAGGLAEWGSLTDDDDVFLGD